MKNNHHTLQEINSQPEAWAEAIQVIEQKAKSLEQFWQEGEFDRVIFTGCGSTYYLSLAGANLFQQLTGVTAQAVPGGELYLYPNSIYPRAGRDLLVAVSRSGTTTETIQALKAFRDMERGRAVVITNYPASPLAGLGDLVIGIPKGQEQSVAQTRSYACMYVATAAMSVLIGGRQDLFAAMAELPGIGERLLNAYDSLARMLGEDMVLDKFFFLGSGPRYGLACEANLKMKEMSLTHSEPFHFLEFRHGPMSLVSDTTLVIGLLSETNRVHEQAVLSDMEKLGAHLLTLGEDRTDVAFKSGLAEEIRNVLYLPVLQLMSYYRAIAKGLNPDNPKHLTAVIELDL